MQTDLSDGNRGEEVNKRMKYLSVKALCGSGKAYRKLGILFWTGKGCERDRILAGLCLKHAAELGDEEGYFLYHRLFSKGKKVIDDRSYEELWDEYEREKDQKKKRRLAGYLKLGTKRQKRKQRGRTYYGKHIFLQ